MEKCAIVIGGSGSIGSEVVQALLQLNLSVIAVGRSQDKLDRLATCSSDKLFTYSADCTQESQVGEMLRWVNDKQGRIDYLIHTVALPQDADVPLANCRTESWNTTFDTYVRSFFLCFREVLGVMQPEGHIVAVSSAITRLRWDNIPPMLYAGHYAAAKAALDELCKWSRREAHERGVLLSRIAPGAVDTPQSRNAPPHRRSAAFLPLSLVASKIVDAIVLKTEIDEIMVANR